MSGRRKSRNGWDRTKAQASRRSQSRTATSHSNCPFPFVAAGSIGLYQWKFQQSDPDFFPSIPHGHWRSDKRRRLDAYRGWTYQEDRQFGREPRWRSLRCGTTRSFAPLQPQQFSTTWLPFRDMCGRCRIRSDYLVAEVRGRSNPTLQRTRDSESYRALQQKTPRNIFCVHGVPTSTGLATGHTVPELLCPS